MSQIIMALDQGTTSSRTILFNENGKIVAQANAPLACHSPQSGWVAGPSQHHTLLKHHTC